MPNTNELANRNHITDEFTFHDVRLEPSCQECTLDLIPNTQ